MSEKLTYSISIQVAGGPKLSASNTLQIEGYDKTQVTLAPATVDKVVNIQQVQNAHTPLVK